MFSPSAIYVIFFVSKNKFCLLERITQGDTLSQTTALKSIAAVPGVSISIKLKKTWDTERSEGPYTTHPFVPVNFSMTLMRHMFVAVGSQLSRGIIRRLVLSEGLIEVLIHTHN